MEIARIIYWNDDRKLNTIIVKSADDYELHDGFVRYKDDQRNWHVLPMHRVHLIEQS